MTTTSHPLIERRASRPGYVSVISVLSLTTVMFVVLLTSYRSSIQSQEVQESAQLRIDYTHREQALLRGILTEAPNQAMSAMMKDSGGSDWQVSNRWRWVFEYARDIADGETALEGDIAGQIGITSDAVGDIGDGEEGHIINNVTATITESANHMFYVNSGTNGTGTTLGSGYPEALILADTNVVKQDRDRPIITSDKTYAGGVNYKLIPYPAVHFGYSTQGQNFVAKRNWWAFSVEYGKTTSSTTGIKSHKKDYVLSIYEVPSQLALGSNALTYLGQHADGSTWQNVAISGGVFASRAATEGTIALDRLASRKGVALGGSSTVGGLGHNEVTGTITTREEYEAANADFYPLSSSADSGLVAFIPINRGDDAFDALSNTDDSGSASPTGWNSYSRPAMQCAMNLRVTEVAGPADQTPLSIEFTYIESNVSKTAEFIRGENWPDEDSTEGATFPFHVEELPSGRTGVSVHAGRLATWLTDNGADSLANNHSLLIDADYVGNIDISKPNIPSTDSDIALVLRDTGDFTMFPNGFSLVTPFRMYLANDVNLVPTGTDAGGNNIFPPLSLFAPEKRFGARNQALLIDFQGQLNYLNSDDASPTRPLDLRSGSNDEIVADHIAADLYSISDPSRLPPISQVNWLVVIEEVVQ